MRARHANAERAPTIVSYTLIAASCFPDIHGAFAADRRRYDAWWNAMKWTVLRTIPLVWFWLWQQHRSIIAIRAGYSFSIGVIRVLVRRWQDTRSFERNLL